MIKRLSSQVARYLLQHHLALLALLIAMGGTTYAATLARNSVGSAQIKNGKVRAIDLGANSVTGTRIKNLAVSSADIADGAVTSSKQAVVPAVQVFTGSPTTIPDEVATLLSFSAEAFDTAGMHDATNPSRLTAPVAGIYMVNAIVEWDSNATGFRQIQLKKNGDPNRFSTTVLSSNATGFLFQPHVDTVSLAAGDYVELYVRETSGAPVTIYGADGDETHFGMTWIGPNA